MFDLQKGYLPPSFLQQITSSPLGEDAFLLGWYNYLPSLARSPKWRLSNGQAGGLDECDFTSSMLNGHIPAKDAFQSQGGISNAVNTYDPTRGETRPSICAKCGSSFWSHENGNTWKGFANWGIPEYRTDKSECPTQQIVRVDGRERKVCGHIISGPYETEQAAQIACPKENFVVKIDNQWVVICGETVNLMSFSNYVHKYVMKPIKAENRRFISAKTKGRTNLAGAFTCPSCNQLNELQEAETDDDSENYYRCRFCDSLQHPNEVQIIYLEKTSVSLSTPISEDGKATIGDMIPSPERLDEELAQCEYQIQETLADFTARLQAIVDFKLKDAESKLKDRQLTKIPQLERSFKRARAKGDKTKIEKVEKKLRREKESLVKDENKIEYTGNLVTMFKLHYIGDDEGVTWDLRKLTERFMFKCLPHTVCRDCGYKHEEQNEKGKMELQQRNARVRLRRLAEQGEVDGYDRDVILNTPEDELLPKLGSFFHCEECGGSKLDYYGPGSRNPDNPRVEITPHIFQPAQREIRELESQIFSYKLLCPNCDTSNNVRPDRMTGEILDHKISKKIVEENGVRKAVREKAQHSCLKCNHPLTLNDVVKSSNAKDAYSLLMKLHELVQERELLRQAIRRRHDGDNGWRIQ